MAGDNSSNTKSDNTPVGGTTVDVMSPYFISASDNPNTVFVSDLLRDGNYADWVDEMSNALFAKNKFGFVDGTIPAPSEGATDLLLWKRCNAMVKGWLNSAMEKEIRNSVKPASKAQEIWEDLGERFGSESAPRAYELKRAITLTRQERLSVSAYYTKLKGLWDEIQSIAPTPKCKCGGCTCDIPKKLTEMRERERLYEFLMGLDASFGTIKTQILSMKPAVNLGTAYHLVSEDERHKQIAANGKVEIEAAAFQVSGNQRSNREEGKGVQREKPKCTHCGKLYHTIENCYEIIGYPEGKKKGDRNGERGADSRIKQRGTVKSANLATGSTSPIPGFSDEQYKQLVQFFSEKSSGDLKVPPSANMAGLSFEDSDWDG